MKPKNSSAPSSSPNAKRPLSVGDRVSVSRGGYKLPFKGTVKGTNEEFNTVVVHEDGFYSAHADSPFHPVQCRRLKPKKKVTTTKTARIVYVNDYESCYGTAVKSLSQANNTASEGRLGEAIKFREVLPGEVVITQYAMARAMRQAYNEIPQMISVGARESLIAQTKIKLGFKP
jgi:hypothetical protein